MGLISKSLFIMTINILVIVHDVPSTWNIYILGCRLSVGSRNFKPDELLCGREHKKLWYIN